MAVIPDGNAQINWKFTGANVPHGAETTIGVDLGNPAYDPAAVAAIASTVWQDNWLDIQTEDTVLSSILVKFGPNDDGPFTEIAVGVGGGEGEDAIPPNCALLLRKVTANGGRRNRGRMFIPGLPEDILEDGGTVAATPLGVYNTRAQQMFDDLVAADLSPVVLHNDAHFPTPITEITVASTIATQRRRLRP